MTAFDCAGETKDSDSPDYRRLLGGRVMVLDHVRPSSFAGKRGTLVSVHEGELGVRVGSPRSNTRIVWFRPDEVAIARVGLRSSAQSSGLRKA